MGACNGVDGFLPDACRIVDFAVDTEGFEHWFRQIRNPKPEARNPQRPKP